MHIKVRVTPESKKEDVKQLDDTTYAVFVKEKARHNAANIRMLELLSKQLSLPKERLQIITGHHSPNKIIFIRND